jgi:hypothetical protein
MEAGSSIRGYDLMSETRFVWWCGAAGEVKDGSGPECGTVESIQGAPAVTRDDTGVYTVENAIIWCSFCGRLAPHDEGCRWIESKSVQYMVREANDG